MTKSVKVILVVVLAFGIVYGVWEVRKMYQELENWKADAVTVINRHEVFIRQIDGYLVTLENRVRELEKLRDEKNGGK